MGEVVVDVSSNGMRYLRLVNVRRRNVLAFFVFICFLGALTETRPAFGLSFFIIIATFLALIGDPERGRGRGYVWVVG